MRFYANQTSHFSLNAVMFPILIAVVSAPITDHYERNNGNFYSTKLSLSLSLSLSLNFLLLTYFHHVCCCLPPIYELTHVSFHRRKHSF